MRIEAEKGLRREEGRSGREERKDGIGEEGKG